MGMVCFVVFPLSFCLLVGAYCIHHAYFGAMCTLVPCALWCILSQALSIHTHTHTYFLAIKKKL